MKKKVPTQETPPKAEEHETREEKSTVSRRKFLKASALGAGALALPNVACASTDPSLPGGSGGNNKDTPTAPSKQAPDYTTQADTWVEPWEFVQKEWPGQQLTLNVVEHAAPVAIFGDVGKAQDANVGQLLFSWNGISPAPTMRVGGNEILNVKVRNVLGPNDGTLHIPNGTVPPNSVTTPAQWISGGYTTATPDYCRPIHSNHKHQIRTTNIHFHGSHVSPYQNTDGTHSDDIYLRIIPQGDYLLREASQDPECWPYKGSEVSGEADYQYRLGKSSEPQRLTKTHRAVETHPPGTHWYHPHAHGSTFTQVASGMAGLIIVEGDVDEKLKEQLYNPDPKPVLGLDGKEHYPVGPSYDERVFVIQRIVGPTPVDLEDSFQKDGQFKTKSSSVFAAVNGQSTTTVENYIVLEPEVVERWRVLNAGVDGQAYIDFMVLDLVEQDDLTVVLDTENSIETITWNYRGPNGTTAPVTRQVKIAKGGGVTPSADLLVQIYKEMEEYQYGRKAGAFYHHLASDGITLVTETTLGAEYHSRPVTQPTMLSPANRADFLFQAPSLPAPTTAVPTPYKLLSVWIRQTITGTDALFGSAGATGTKTAQKIATIIVRGVPNPPPSDTNVNQLEYPPVPDYLLPVTDDDITVKEGDPDFGKKTKNSGSNANNNGKRRGRRVIYSGWGGAGFPATSNRPNQLIAYIGNPQGSTAQTGGISGAESMMIDCRKFNDDPDDLGSIGHHMLIETAEEWTVSNFSMSLFKAYTKDGKTIPADPITIPGDIPAGYDSRPVHLGDNPYVSAEQKPNVSTRAVDHPFHIHINPCWVTGLYDWSGEPLNWNYEPVTDEEPFYPRWHDVIRLPRNGGWVVFRSRFWDYAGEYVNHCHILQHEDNGMMQGIAVILKSEQADYIPLDAGKGFPRPTWLDCYTLDWGIGGTDAQAAADRAACDKIRDALRKPV